MNGRYGRKLLATMVVLILGLALFACGSDDTTTDNNDQTDDQTTTDTIDTVTAGADDLVAAVRSDDYLFGYINTAGDWVIAPAYTSASPFSDGLALVCAEDNAWQIIDKSGTVQAVLPDDVDPIIMGKNSSGGDPLTEFIAPEHYSICDGMIAVIADGKYGFVNTAGETVVAPQYVEVMNYREGLAAVNFNTNEDPLWGFIDTDGNVVIPGTYALVRSFANGMAYVEFKYDQDPDLSLGDCGFINTSGEAVIHATGTETALGYDWIGMGGYITDFNTDGLAFAEYYSEDGLQTVLIDTTGQILWTDTENIYSATGHGDDLISEDLYQFSVLLADDEYGEAVLNTSGQEIVAGQTQWKFYYPCTEGLIMVFDQEDTHMYGFINTSGELVIPCDIQMGYAFYNGYASVMRNGEYSYIDATGNVAISGDFTSIGLPFTK